MFTSDEALTTQSLVECCYALAKKMVVARTPCFCISHSSYACLFGRTTEVRNLPSMTRDMVLLRLDSDLYSWGRLLQTYYHDVEDGQWSDGFQVKMCFPVSELLTIDSVGNYSFPGFSYYWAIQHDMLHQKDSSHLMTIRYLSLDINSCQGIVFSLHQTNFSSRSHSISSTWRQ